MRIKSVAFPEDGLIPSKYTCNGPNIQPPIRITGVPGHTKCLCIIVDDKDSTHEDFVHWIVWNIPPDQADIIEGAVPDDARQGTNDFGELGWSGPCPTTGKHRYELHVYALDKLLNLPVSSTKSDVSKAIAKHIIEESILTSYYERSNI